MKVKLSKYYIGLVLLAGCLGKGERTSFPNDGRIKKMTYGSHQLAVEVMPSSKDNHELIFQAKFTLSKEHVPQDKDFLVHLQYNIDSSFYLTANKDTAWPLYVMPIANGQAYNPQYIAAFDNAVLHNSEIKFHSRIRGIEFTEPSDLVFNSKNVKAFQNN